MIVAAGNTLAALGITASVYSGYHHILAGEYDLLANDLTGLLGSGIVKKAGKRFANTVKVAAPKAVNDDAARAALRKALGQEGTGKVAHHLIPLEAQKKLGNLLERGRRGGFDINGKGNGRLLDAADHIDNHSLYNQDVLRHLDSVNDAAIRSNLSDIEVAELLQEAADTLGNAIDSGTYGPWG